MPHTCTAHLFDPDTPTSSLTLLIVEDDHISRKMLSSRIAPLFKSVVMAEDGDTGFQLFCEQKPDIVLTDQIMPGLSGLDLMSKIRATGAKTPVVLMTSTIDNDILLEAINRGVERFVPKPFDFRLLTRTLTNIARELCNERLLEQHHRQEVELLRYRDAYNSMQQEAARRKERHVVRHDLCNQILPGSGGVRWGINVAYAPRDIMCGDGYSVRHLCDGRQLVFVVDAMGSGMSASLSAMLTTSFCNFRVETLNRRGTFVFEQFLQRFQEYLSGMLLEEEVLSCGFFLLDLEKEELTTAVFALPPLLLRGLDGSIRRIRGENPPLGIYPGEVNISTISLADVADLLIMTDGVTDALLLSGGSYREALEEDFRDAPTLAAFQRCFSEKTDQDERDDLTLLHVRRLDFDSGWHWRCEPDISLSGISRAIHECIAALTAETGLKGDPCDELEVALTEALTNALEHGCLGIDREEKTRLQMSGEYDDVLEHKSAMRDAVITLSATVWRGAGQLLLIMEVCDNGPGVPVGLLSAEVNETSVNGRGLRMIRRFSDSVFVGGTGGQLVMVTTLEQGESHAD